MKKFAIVLVTLLAGINFAFANSTEPTAEKFVEVKVLDGLKFKIAIPELNDKGTVSIKNAAGETLYRESIDNSPAFVKVYNLTGFPDGDYSFEVKINGKVISKDVKINTTVSRLASVN